MTDNLKRKAPEDTKKININQPWEVKYWSEKFGISVAKLKEAVRKAGVMVEDVKVYLEK